MDRFGTMPKPVENLLSIAYLKSMAHLLEIKDIKADRNEIKLVMYENAEADGTKIPDLLKKYKNQLKFRPDNPSNFIYMYPKDAPRDEISQLETLQKLLEDMSIIQVKKDKFGQKSGKENNNAEI